MTKRVSEEQNDETRRLSRHGSDSMFKHSNLHFDSQKKGEPTGSSPLRDAVRSVKEEVPDKRWINEDLSSIIIHRLLNPEWFRGRKLTSYEFVENFVVESSCRSCGDVRSSRGYDDDEMRHSRVKVDSLCCRDFARTGCRFGQSFS